MPLEVQRPLDVTPDNEVDVTPVYGDLNDSIELQLGDDSLAYRQNDYLQSRDIFQSHMEPIGRPGEIPVAQSDPVPVPVAEPNVPEPDDSNDNDNEVSYEGERPPTPTLVRELQEEESMECTRRWASFPPVGEARQGDGRGAREAGGPGARRPTCPAGAL